MADTCAERLLTQGPGSAAIVAAENTSGKMSPLEASRSPVVPGARRGAPSVASAGEGSPSQLAPGVLVGGEPVAHASAERTVAQGSGSAPRIASEDRRRPFTTTSSTSSLDASHAPVVPGTTMGEPFVACAGDGSPPCPHRAYRSWRAPHGRLRRAHRRARVRQRAGDRIGRPASPVRENGKTGDAHLRQHLQHLCSLAQNPRARARRPTGCPARGGAHRPRHARASGPPPCPPPGVLAAGEPVAHASAERTVAQGSGSAPGMASGGRRAPFAATSPPGAPHAPAVPGARRGAPSAARAGDGPPPCPPPGVLAAGEPVAHASAERTVAQGSGSAPGMASGGRRAPITTTSSPDASHAPVLSGTTMGEPFVACEGDGSPPHPPPGVLAAGEPLTDASAERTRPRKGQAARRAWRLEGRRAPITTTSSLDASHARSCPARRWVSRSWHARAMARRPTPHRA